MSLNTRTFDDDNIRRLCTHFLEALRPIATMNRNLNFTPTEIAIAYMMAGEYNLVIGNEHWGLTNDEIEAFRREARLMAIDLYKKSMSDEERGIRFD